MYIPIVRKKIAPIKTDYYCNVNAEIDNNRIAHELLF